MFHTVYQITNKINGKIYVGKHSTMDLNDGYMGSGKLIRVAIRKYGVENFTKEILHVFDAEVDMNTKEREIVNEEFLKRDDVYNLKLGGDGGFSHINNNPKLVEQRAKTFSENYIASLETRKKISLANKGRTGTFTGKSHTQASKDLIRLAATKQTHSLERRMQHSKVMKVVSKGSNNSQFGTRWITNGSVNKKIQNSDAIPAGWWYGRAMR